MRRDRLIRDPIYDYISLPADLADVLDHPLYQRLRRVLQTSLTSTVYPSATGSRFEHGLGAMHLAGQAWCSAWRNASAGTRDAFVEAAHVEFPALAAGAAQFGDRMHLAVSGVALLHDVGHPPFSHVLEYEYQRMISDHLREEDALLQEWRSFGSPLHEFAGVVLTRRLASQIAENIRGLLLRVYEADPDDGTWAGVAHSVVAGEIDVDRLDYLMRDAQKAGTEFGAIDHLRLIDSLELHFDGERFRIAPGVRGRSAVETLLMQRSQSYKWITYHHRVVGSNLALARAVETLRSLSAADDVVRVDNREQALSGWFGGHVPNLNYLAPTLMDITTALTPERENEEQQLTLEDHLQADWVRGVVDQLRGSVDDGAVIEWLRRGSLLARALLHRGTLTEPLRVRLLEFVAYSEAAMFRVKNFMPTWKTVEEFAGAAYEMGPALLAATIEAFDTLIDRLEGAPRELVVAIREQREHLTEAIKGDPVAGSNRLLALTASTVSQAELLRYALQEQRNEVLGVPGFWDVQYTSFKPVRMAGNLTVLYRDDLPYTLLEHSPLVQSLEDVERHRPKLFAFFFLRSSVAFSAFDKDKVREVRAALTGEFISTFPQFVRRHLADSLFATFNGGHDA